MRSELLVVSSSSSCVDAFLLKNVISPSFGSCAIPMPPGLVAIAVHDQINHVLTEMMSQLTNVKPMLLLSAGATRGRTRSQRWEEKNDAF
jgi:hypothetical protein